MPKASGRTAVEFTPIHPEAMVFQAQIGHYRFSVRHPDDKGHPALWDSSLTIADQAAQNSCLSKPLLLEKVFTFDGVSQILLVSSNGSLTLIDLMDPTSCRTLQLIKAFTEVVAVQGVEVQIKPGYECEDADHCSCYAGKVLRMTSRGELRADLKESGAFTL